DENFIVDPDHLSSPRHAFPNFDGTGIFVSDQIEDVVYEYDLDGNYIGIFAPATGPDPSILDNVRGMAISPSGDRLWVATAYTVSAPGGVAEFDPAGNFVGYFIEPGEGGLPSPSFIHVREGDVLVSDSGDDGIYRYDLDGNFLDVWN